MSTQAAPQKKKGGKNAKDQLEIFEAPDMEALSAQLDDKFVLKSALENAYQPICGSLDAKEHPLAAYIAEKQLLSKRNEYNKSPFDLAASVGNKDFLRTLLERSEKLEASAMLNVSSQLTSASYNWLHYACVWGHLELCKFLAEHPKLINDPNVPPPPVAPAKGEKEVPPPQVTLGSFLLRAKAKTGETPKQLAKRYGRDEIENYLNYAEIRQTFMDRLNEIKLICSDPEKNMNKLPKDDKKKMEKLVAECTEWLDKNKENNDVELLKQKIDNTEDVVRPLLDALSQRISQTPVPDRAASRKSNK